MPAEVRNRSGRSQRVAKGRNRRAVSAEQNVGESDQVAHEFRTCLFVQVPSAPPDRAASHRADFDGHPVELVSRI
jgi:hypothetical protein